MTYRGERVPVDAAAVVVEERAVDHAHPDAVVPDRAARAVHPGVVLERAVDDREGADVVDRAPLGALEEVADERRALDGDVAELDEQAAPLEGGVAEHREVAKPDLHARRRRRGRALGIAHRQGALLTLARHALIRRLHEQAADEQRGERRELVGQDDVVSVRVDGHRLADLEHVVQLDRAAHREGDRGAFDGVGHDLADRAAQRAERLRGEALNPKVRRRRVLRRVHDVRAGLDGAGRGCVRGREPQRLHGQAGDDREDDRRVGAVDEQRLVDEPSREVAAPTPCATRAAG